MDRRRLYRHGHQSLALALSGSSSFHRDLGTSANASNTRSGFTMPTSRSRCTTSLLLSRKRAPFASKASAVSRWTNVQYCSGLRPNSARKADGNSGSATPLLAAAHTFDFVLRRRIPKCPPPMFGYQQTGRRCARLVESKGTIRVHDRRVRRQTVVQRIALPGTFQKRCDLRNQKVEIRPRAV